MRITTPRLVFTLCVLLGINTMNFFDRQILPAVQEKIRKDWQREQRPETPGQSGAETYVYT